MKYLVQLKRLIKSTGFKFSHLSQDTYTCPICEYQGPFANFVLAESEIVKDSRCPSCDSFERHRLQKLVIEQLRKDINFWEMRMLHFAPEYFFKEYFEPLVAEYITADLSMNNVDYQVDLTNLPFKDAEFDIVFASHVLEHIKDDHMAISEIRRVLKPKGIAILPVPIVGVQTIEYPQPNPLEAGHVRAPGLDYYERYSNYFRRVEKFSSEDFPNHPYQLFVYEDRSIYPTKNCPWRQPMAGTKHIDIVPVCFI